MQKAIPGAVRGIKTSLQPVTESHEFIDLGDETLLLDKLLLDKRRQGTQGVRRPGKQSD